MTLAIIISVIVVQAVALSLAMSLGWIIERRTGNSGYVDAVWTFSVGAVGAVSALLPLHESGMSPRQVLIAAFIATWALRLGLHILWRSSSRPEDPRYAAMIREWGADASQQMFLLLQKQALVAIPLVFGVFCAALNPSPSLSAQDAIAIAVFLIAVIGEAVADRQLRAFSSDPSNKGQVCDKGLWRYSRHPNYFFEWLHWTVYPLAGILAGGGWALGWFALLAPLVMYWLLVHVSGIPPLEAHMLRRYGSLYGIYQRRTNAFFPGPVKHV